MDGQTAGVLRSNHAIWRMPRPRSRDEVNPNALSNLEREGDHDCSNRTVRPGLTCGPSRFTKIVEARHSNAIADQPEPGVSPGSHFHVTRGNPA